MSEINKETLTYINCLCASQMVLECMDELRETDAYKAKVKTTANNFVIQITKNFIDGINDIYAAQDETCNEIIGAIENVCKELATLDPVKIGELSDMIKSVKYDEQLA